MSSRARLMGLIASTGGLVSGHTIKHAIAAAAVLVVALHLGRRHVIEKSS